MGAMKQRLLSVKFSEHYSQAQTFWNSITPIEKAHLIAALSFELDHCDDPIVYERMITRLTDISLDLAQAEAVKAGAPTPTKAGRPNHGKTVKGPLSAAGAMVFTIGPKRQPVKSAGGKSVTPEHHFEGMRSTLFDALYIPGGEHIPTLAKQGRVVHCIREAFGHCKAIGATGEAVGLLRTAVGIEGMVFATGNEEAAVVDCYGVVTSGGVSGGEGVLKMVKGAKGFLDAFAFNVSQHRNFQRELEGLTEMIAY